MHEALSCAFAKERTPRKISRALENRRVLLSETCDLTIHVEKGRSSDFKAQISSVAGVTRPGGADALANSADRSTAIRTPRSESSARARYPDSLFARS